MKRTATIGAVCLAVAMMFVAGCETSTLNPQPIPADGGAAVNPKATDTADPPANARPVVVIETSMGLIKAELWSDAAPVTVKNFLAYVDAKHYDGLIFHRVMRGFMIQGGGFDPAMREKACRAPIKNEAAADKKNDRGTLAMARTPLVDSATSQFFINLVDNDFLNHRDNSSRGFGYCAFGKVTEGLGVVDKIGAAAVGGKFGRQNVPTKTVLIKTIRRAK